MHWFSLKTLGACALLVSACSDDGVPLAGEETDGAGTATASASGPGGTAPGTAVTTADPSSATSSDSNATATTDPSGNDTDAGTEGTTNDSAESTGDTDGPTGGSSSSTGGTTEPECVMDDDCLLLDDCCTCDAIAVGEEAPECVVMDCFVNTCTSLGLEVPAVECNFGTCEVEEVSCDPLSITCDGKDAIAPMCPDGQAPRVVEGCWGGCIPVEYCDVVPGCESCNEDEACIESGIELGSLFCVPIPLECEGVVSCDCLGEACEEPFTSCSDTIKPKNGAELSCAAG